MSIFDPKSPRGSVPNVQSKFLTRDAIRWFKCKLKPPKKEGFNIIIGFEGSPAISLPRCTLIIAGGT